MFYLVIFYFEYDVVTVGVLKQEENVNIKNIVNVYQELVVRIVVVVGE
jgi:hypothetical protein